MNIFILEDDAGIIAVLEQIIDSQNLGVVCGDSADSVPTIEEILQARPDIILLDFLMPVRDGVETTKQLRAAGCTAKCIMISQVSSKEMIAEAYHAGVDFFINKPINVIEVRSVISNAANQLQNERKLQDIGRLFGQGSAPVGPGTSPGANSAQLKRIQGILSQLGMSGEKGTGDILRICQYLLENSNTAGNMSIGALCETLSEVPKTMEQRVRRAIATGMSNLAHLGCEDFMNDTFAAYSGTLFPFEDIRLEMDFIRGKRSAGGKISLRRFLDGLLTLSAD